MTEGANEVKIKRLEKYSSPSAALADFLLTTTMNSVLLPASMHAQSLSQADNSLHDLLHELRQPLSVIETLAYYLELTLEDDNAGPHLQRIQAMVREANAILAQAGALH